MQSMLETPKRDTTRILNNIQEELDSLYDNDATLIGSRVPPETAQILKPVNNQVRISKELSPDQILACGQKFS